MRKLNLLLIVFVSIMLSAVLAQAEGKGSGRDMEKGSDHDMKVDAVTEATPKTEKVQKIMKEFIDAELCGEEGVCSIDGRETAFGYIHDGIKKTKDGFAISCVDFKAGDSVLDVDLYVGWTKDEWKVEKAVLHKENGEIVDKILWEASESKGSDPMGMKGLDLMEMKGSGAMEYKGSN